MIHVPEATARELMNLAAAENDQDQVPSHFHLASHKMKKWFLVKSCFNVSSLLWQLLLDPWVVCTCRGWRPVKLSPISHLPHLHHLPHLPLVHSQCQLPAGHSRLQVKGKGEMLTYYVDLTDELFLVEKRRHGDEDEDEDEDEQQWEDLRF